MICDEGLSEVTGRLLCLGGLGKSLVGGCLLRLPSSCDCELSEFVLLGLTLARRYDCEGGFFWLDSCCEICRIAANSTGLNLS